MHWLTKPSREIKMSELYEELAAIQHDIWAHWQKYVHDHKIAWYGTKRVLFSEDIERWDKQISTPYADLTEKEKDGDREQVDKFWHLISGLDTQLSQANERIKALENPWVSVDERLPEDDDNYLVRTIGGEYLVRWSHALGERLDNTWKAHYTHWRPIIIPENTND